MNVNMFCRFFNVNIRFKVLLTEKKLLIIMLFSLRGTEATAKASGTIWLTFLESLYFRPETMHEHLFRKSSIINPCFSQESLLI